MPPVGYIAASWVRDMGKPTKKPVKKTVVPKKAPGKNRQPYMLPKAAAKTIMEKRPRLIVQLVGGTGVGALCNDGSVWTLDHTTKQWKRCADIPQGDIAVCEVKSRETELTPFDMLGAKPAPSDMPLDMPLDMATALELDGEKLAALTGEDHGPVFPDDDSEEPTAQPPAPGSETPEDGEDCI